MTARTCCSCSATSWDGDLTRCTLSTRTTISSLTYATGQFVRALHGPGEPDDAIPDRYAGNRMSLLYVHFHRAVAATLLGNWAAVADHAVPAMELAAPMTRHYIGAPIRTAYALFQAHLIRNGECADAPALSALAVPHIASDIGWVTLSAGTAALTPSGANTPAELVRSQTPPRTRRSIWDVTRCTSTTFWSPVDLLACAGGRRDMVFSVAGRMAFSRVSARPCRPDRFSHGVVSDSPPSPGRT